MIALRRVPRKRPLMTALVGMVVVATAASGVVGLYIPSQNSASAAPLSNGHTVTPAALLNGAGTGAPTGRLAIDVVSSRDSLAAHGPHLGDAVTTFKWLIQEDNSGDPHQTTMLDSAGHVVMAPNGQPLDPCHPAWDATTNSGLPNGDPAFPANCNWPSIHSMDAAPVVSEGTQADWNKALTLPVDGFAGSGTGLAAGTTQHPKKYLVSVLADGYQLGGAHFTVPMNADTAGSSVATVHVALNPYPVPLGTIRLRVFSDTAPTNGQWDPEAEPALRNFEARLADYNGPVTVDYFGNPLCTTYRTNRAGRIMLSSSGQPTVLQIGGHCLSDQNGDIVIPNLAPNRYGASVLSPEGQTWTQTTTLEGNHDWDVWVQPNDTGYDTEMVVGGEAVPFVDVGFVPPHSLRSFGSSGEIKGRLMESSVYFPGFGGLQSTMNLTAGTGGVKLTDPIPDGYVVLNDLNNNDTTVYAGPANPDGTYDIKHVPNGDYAITLWDVRQEWILDTFNVTVDAGKVVDLGNTPLAGWFTHLYGTVFVDKNGNGKQDPGEEGVRKFTLQNLDRTNNAMESGQQTADTDNQGHYDFAELYPLGQYSVLQFFNNRYKTTGITYQTCNDKQEHTVVTAIVDLSYNAVIGQCGRVDVGVQVFDAASGDNGGIVATAIYDSIRQKYSARQAQTLAQQNGIPGISFELYQPVSDGHGGFVRNANGSYATNVPDATHGGDPSGPNGVQTYVSENWAKPTGCVPLDVNGDPFTQQDAMWSDPTIAAGRPCVEAPMTGLGFGVGDDVAHAPQVDGNYGLAAPAGDYIVKTVVPTDMVLNNGKPLYKTTTEADVNTASGENFIPQNAEATGVAWPPLPATPKQQAQAAPGEYGENPHTTATGPDPICAGATFTVDVASRALAGDRQAQNFLAVGGSPFEGQQRSYCDEKLFHIEAGQSIAPNFHFFTDVPIATKFTGLIVDDVNVTTDRKSTGLGEVRGIANAPTGVYDWTGQLVDEVDSDYNGIWEVIEPSSDITNCPTPSGVCPEVYRFVGNDPGQPGKPNVNYQPGYRTIAANFQAWPGNFVPADTAPTMAAASIQAPGAIYSQLAVCAAAATTPQLMAVDNPYVIRTTGNQRNTMLNIDGDGFGNRGTASSVQLVNESGANPTVTYTWHIVDWSPTHITVDSNTLPSGLGSVAPGPYELRITTAAGVSTSNALTYHVIAARSSYSPNVITVGPGKQFDPTRSYTSGRAAGLGAIQQAIESATDQQFARRGNSQQLIVVYPAPAAAFTPLGTYYENLIMHSALKLQGVGPGGVRSDGTSVQGSIIDGRYFWNASTSTGSGSQNAEVEPYALAWENLVAAIGTWDGYQNITAGQDIYVVARRSGQSSTIGSFGSSFRAAIDGFTLQGGDQRDFPGNIQEIGGAKTGPSTGAVETQGGAVFLNAWANYLQLSNNVVQSNSGAFGSIRLGTAFLNESTSAQQHNNNVLIEHNRILANGGTNLAGALGIFSGSDNYRVTDNDFCGNSSTEYGGAIGHYGLSNNGRIDHNRIDPNSSIDEGGGVLIGGEVPLPSAPGAALNVSPGSGAVTIDHNVVAANLGNDDGGGIRLLMVGDSLIRIDDNIVTNNISTHEGAGISIDDAPWVVIANNTIAKNVTTATATTSDGSPAPAGVSTAKLSTPLYNQLRQRYGSSVNQWAIPTIVNDVFWDNRAGSWTAGGVAGIGQPGDLTPINYWDIGSADHSAPLLQPSHSTFESDPLNAFFGFDNSAGNNVVGVNPQFVAPYDITLSIAAWRSYFRFRPAAIVAVDLPSNPLGNYRPASSASPVFNIGVGTFAARYRNTTPTMQAVSPDIDGVFRPQCSRWDAGASEIQAC